MKVGFVGLGNMGEPMATNLLKAGFELTVNDVRTELKEKMLELGASWADTAKQVAQASEVFITSLPKPSDVEEVALGEEGLLAGASESDIFLDMSTNFPATIKKIAEKAKAKGVTMLDAPVSGGVRGAKRGTLTIMVGGDESSFKKCQKILEVLGEHIYFVGGLGAGTVAKLVNNLLALANIAIAAEGMVLGVKAGVDPMRLFEVIDASTGTSFAFKGLFPNIIFKGRFEPPTFSIGLASKDLQLAVDYAKEMNLPMSLGSEVLKTYESAKAKGLDNKDVGAVITLLEEAAGIEVRTAQQ
ncbi:NAD(P)-dependent oxidoreductase [Chloroflexota bacterium]